MLTEPIKCSSCGAISVNGARLHCPGCYKELGEKLTASERRCAELEAQAFALRVSGGKERLRAQSLEKRCAELQKRVEELQDRLTSSLVSLD